jgi:hypothetical protein
MPAESHPIEHMQAETYMGGYLQNVTYILNGQEVTEQEFREQFAQDPKPCTQCGGYVRPDSTLRICVSCASSMTTAELDTQTQNR